MSTSQERQVVEDSPGRGDSPWPYRAGMLLVLCSLALLLVGPILPWFHTELTTSRPDLSGIPPTSFLEYLIRPLSANVSSVLGIALTYLILALGASLAGIRTLAAAARRQDRRGEGGDAQVGILAALCGASILGLFMVGLLGMNGRMPLDWTDSRVVPDAGYVVTLAGFLVALVGNGLIALARTKNA
jgi:hypothetical protein